MQQVVSAHVDGAQRRRRRFRASVSLSGQSTQPDPIGLAGGLNLYGYAGGDPLGGRDPFGLKVCFEGSRQDELIRGVEDATNSTITVDDFDGCITKVEAREGTGFALLRHRLNRLVARSQRYTIEHGAIGRTGSYSEDGRVTVNLDLIAAGVLYPVEVAGACLPFNMQGRNRFTVGSVIAHELLAHAWYGLSAVEDWDEILGVSTENLYYRARGRPERACY